MPKTLIAGAVFLGIVAGYTIGFVQNRQDYSALLARWNRLASLHIAKQMHGTGNWFCGRMVVSCNEDGYLDFEGNFPDSAE